MLLWTRPVASAVAFSAGDDGWAVPQPTIAATVSQLPNVWTPVDIGDRSLAQNGPIPRARSMGVASSDRAPYSFAHGRGAVVSGGRAAALVELRVPLAPEDRIIAARPRGPRHRPLHGRA